jgi:hypothetical protein
MVSLLNARSAPSGLLEGRREGRRDRRLLPGRRSRSPEFEDDDEFDD